MGRTSVFVLYEGGSPWKASRTRSLGFPKEPAPEAFVCEVLAFTRTRAGGPGSGHRGGSNFSFEKNSVLHGTGGGGLNAFPPGGVVPPGSALARTSGRFPVRVSGTAEVPIDPGDIDRRHIDWNESMVQNAHLLPGDDRYILCEINPVLQIP